jgi:hypothetical protein
VQPVQRYAPSIALQLRPDLHAHPQTPQLVSEVVSTGFPPQQRALPSPLFQEAPSASATAAWHTLPEHFGASWQAFGAFPHSASVVHSTHLLPLQCDLLPVQLLAVTHFPPVHAAGVHPSGAPHALAVVHSTQPDVAQ